MAKKAYILGVNTKGLEYAESDAESIGRVLRMHDYQPFRLEPDKNAVQAGLDQLVDQCGQNDTLIFYYSGHGLLERGKLHLLLTEDADTETGKFPVSNITRALEKCRAAHKLLILDCCHAGAAHAEWSLTYSETYSLLTASERLETAKEVEELQAGFLTWLLCQALEKPPENLPDEQHYIRINALYDYVREQAKTYRGKQPDAAELPIPNLIGNHKHNFPLAILSPLDASLQKIADILPDKGALQIDGWIFPIQAAFRQFNTPCLSACLHVADAFLHMHFIALAGQFYWAAREIDPPDDNIRQGFQILGEALRDPACEGGAVWLRRSAVLSKALHDMDRPLPFPELTDILEPLNGEMKEIQSGPAWQFLAALMALRDKPLAPSPVADDKLFFTILQHLGWLFAPWRSLCLAQVQDGDNGPLIYGDWSETRFTQSAMFLEKLKLQQRWSDDLKAPPPPCPGEWDESLLLYDPAKPFERYVYLMPLGFRYSHANAGKSCLPGLLDTVRWKRKHKEVVIAVAQRHYECDPPPSGWQNRLRDEDLAQTGALKQAVQALFEHSLRFSFDTAAAIEPLRPVPAPVYDLLHDQVARQIAANKIERSAEMQRVLDILHRAPGHRLLLEGVSGSGKSVLLAQLFLAHQSQAVYLSLDASTDPLDEEAGGAAARLGMHCLAVLNRLLALDSPRSLLSPLEIRDALRTHLVRHAEKHPAKRFYLLADALNQSLDPGGLFSALPESLPSNLFLLAASQRQDRVREPLRAYQGAWTFADLAELEREEAERLIRTYWCEARQGEPAPAWESFPAALLPRLREAARGLPVWLEDWTKRLRDLQQADPAGFVRRAATEFERHHRDALPDFLAARLARLKRNFSPPGLLDALFWCLSLTPRALSVEELYRAVQALRPVLPDLPPISRSHIETALHGTLGGFTRRLPAGFSDSWLLAHEILGQVFYHQHPLRDKIPEIRLALLPFGALPLPDEAGEDEVRQWLEWLRVEDYEHYLQLAPLLKVSLLEDLQARLRKEKSPDYALVLARLVCVFLFETGEQQRGFARQADLEHALQFSLPPRIRADVQQSLGDIHQELNCLEPALECFERSLALSEELLAEVATLQSRREVGIALNRIGDVYAARNQLDKALETFERSLALSEELQAEAATPQNRRDVAIALNRIGDVYVARNQQDKALESFERSLALREELLAEAATPQNRRDVAMTLNRIGDVYAARNQQDKALETFERWLSISEKLLAEAATPQNRRDVAIVLNSIGDVHVARNQQDKALETFERSLTLREELQAEAATPQNRRDVSIALNRIGDVYVARNQQDKALEAFERDLALSEELWREAKIPQTIQDLVYTQNKLADLYRQQQRGDKAALKDTDWSAGLWTVFAEQVWNALDEGWQQRLPEELKKMVSARTGRPASGLVIAACQQAERGDLLSRLVDFAWWGEQPAQVQEKEQLCLLTRDEHAWGIRWSDVPVTGLLQGNEATDEKNAAALESALRISVSLSLEEKQRIVQSYPWVSAKQLAELQQIFDEEQIKLALLAPEHQTQLGSLAEQHRAEWPRLADVLQP
ncbi:MAG: tetratricopeptide repeat protein [Gammaproteobacteria bacterium]|nr:tetratricopeptide repeat protein [Gammaproteobacteria bacterium]